MDYAAARDTMIESQVRANDINDLALLGAMRVVEREQYVLAEKRAFAYAEVTSPTPSGRWLWKARDFSKLAQAANVVAGERVLIIGGAGGYSAAVFAALGCTVTVLDDVAVDVPEVTSVVGALDSPPSGPFDVVFVDGGVETLPDAWTKVLAEQGRLCVILLKGPMGTANIFTRGGTSVAGRVIFDATVPQLPGFSVAPEFAL
jgi:protein-L-isoaspartate(D-aspartate) O-methyltransferase